MEQMNKSFSIIILAVLFLSILSGTLSAEHPYSTILTAERTEEIITIDGIHNETSWTTTKPLVVTIQDGSIGKLNVILHALYDKDYIYVHAAWQDPTESVAKKLWAFDGNKWLKSGDEDRFAVFWNINNSVKDFNIGGCAMLCHGDRMHTNRPSEKADSWHWKSARTNPVGYADDKVVKNIVQTYESGPLGVETKWVGRFGDAKTGGGYKDNVNEDKSGPRYYELDPNDEEDKRFIFKSEIDNGEAVDITSETVFKKGDTVPGYILEKPRGSRGDIEAKGVWENGVWSLELKRKLNTGHDDDVRFDIAKTYRFGIAVMDNTGGFVGWGHGHSFDLGAKTLEFGGIGSEEVTQLALVRDYLITSKSYVRNENPGLAISTISSAIAVYNTIEEEVSKVDPAIHLTIMKEFVKSRRNPSVESIDGLIQKIDDATLTLQGKREPTKPTLGLKILALWGRVQLYVFILLSVFTIYPLYKTYKTSRTPELSHLGIFLFLVIVPIFFEGLGRIGTVAHILFLQNFSFTTNPYVTLLWAVGMFIALLIARLGFNEVDHTIHSLRTHTTELTEKEERISSLVESSSDAVISVDENLKITLWNEAAEKILGYSKDETVGKSLDMIIPEKYLERHKKGIKRFLKTGKPKIIGTPVELEARRKDGKIIPIELSLSAVKIKGEYLFTGILRDISKRKESEKELKKYSKDLEKSNRLKDIFTDIIRHDLLNPAGSAENMTKLALMEENDPEKIEILENILLCNERIIDMIENASILAKLESGEELELERGDLGVFLKNAVKDMTSLADEKKTKIKTNVEGEFPSMVNPLIFDVFLNLISNAIKYGPKDSEVLVGVKEDGPNWKISVADKGSGIPDKYKEGIFTRFERIDKTGVKGTGLGLAIVKRVAKAHNGKIWVEDNPDGGSVFFMIIPKVN